MPSLKKGKSWASFVNLSSCSVTFGLGFGGVGLGFGGLWFRVGGVGLGFGGLWFRVGGVGLGFGALWFRVGGGFRVRGFMV